MLHAPSDRPLYCAIKLVGDVNILYVELLDFITVFPSDRL